MAKKLKWLLRFTLRFMAAIVIFVVVYLIAVFVLYHIPVNTNPEKGEIPIYINTNGVHTDIVVPVHNEIKDWRQDILFEHTLSKDSTARFVAFGWGDKGFYLDTPEWSDLKTSTAFKAAFYLGTSAMHTRFYNSLAEDDECVRIMITKTDYADLVEYIENSFSHTVDRKVEYIEGAHYNRYDAFYEGMGRYSLFYTCNTWANNALKAAHQKAALWTPYDKGIFYQYK
ncbi:TIGR02117 family protein [Flavobacterium rhizosphaerae]|uniref:TIGR02117 family protein n=1 Tax=Flavobacterium rhizosphaerae TaxID=3163298 RepID=A0ABW8YZ49_9FLAO